MENSLPKSNKLLTAMLGFMLIFTGLPFMVFAQQRTISGRVSDANGPLSNVSVTIKGTTNGTSTSRDGYYTINVPSGAKEIEFSILNYETQTVTIRGSNDISPVMIAAGSKVLEEVVLTGINRVRKSKFSGAANKIAARDIENRPVGSFDQLLQGRAPGVLALTGSGQPGTSAAIIIRGQNSISGGSTPLYIVDGIPVEASVFQGFNSNDFASVDILRDAATQALYGSRGSAGVIVVTTKRGSAGRFKLSYASQFGIKEKPTFAFKPMTTQQLLAAQHDYGSIVGGAANNNDNIPGWFLSKDNPRYGTLTPADQALADRALDSISQINTKWYDEFYRRGTFSNHALSFSGGTGKARFFSSLGIYKEQGIINPSDMKRVTFRNNVDFSDDRFSFAISSNIGYVKRNFDPAFPGFIAQFNSFLIPNIQAPYSKVRNPGGSFATGGNGDIGNSKHVAAQYLDIKNLDKVYNDQAKVTLGVTLGYKISEYLSAAITAGADFRETQNSTYNSREAFVRTAAAGQGSLTQLAGAQSEALARFITTSVRPSLTFSKTFKDKHEVEVTALSEYIQENSKGIGFTGFGIDPRTPNTAGVIEQGNAGNQLYSTIPNALNSKSTNTLASGLGLLRYTYDGRYTITGSYRRDGSSKLPIETRWVGFYSVGGIWEITKERFAKNLKALNTLRLRVSYGGSGDANNFPAEYLYQSTYGTGTYSGLTTQVATYPGNPKAKWETTYTLNTGVDFELFSRRVYGDINWYDKRTKDLYVTRQLPAEAGGFSIEVNAGELQNTGFEWNINADVIRKKDFGITVFANGGYNKNKLLSLGGETPYEFGTSFLKEGLPLGSHYEVKWGGVDAATGQPLYYDLDGKLTNVYSASNSVSDFGTWEAPWKGGFGTNIRFKDMEISLLFSWQRGAYKSDNLEYFVENPVGFLDGGYNQSASLNFWKKPGDVASTPSPLYGTNFSSKLIHKADFLRLRDVTFSYNIPRNALVGNKFISSARFFAQASNLFLWTKWKGIDPEAGAVNINLGEFPNPRAFTAGLNVTF